MRQAKRWVDVMRLKECADVVGARQSSLSLSEAAVLLGFSVEFTDTGLKEIE